MARPSYTICGGQADADRLARQAAVMAPSVYHRPVTGSEQFWRAIVTGDAGVLRRELSVKGREAPLAVRVVRA
jgi:hypothetical protein